MQMVVHAPFGARVCKAWGLAMRKRFCRSFDFELQATADERRVHSVARPAAFVSAGENVPDAQPRERSQLLEQAILQTPLFQTRWRWNMNRALLVLKMCNGQKVPPALQRFRSDDLLTALLPKLTGCQENIVGDHELPDHPMVMQTMHDCLTEAMKPRRLASRARRHRSGTDRTDSLATLANRHPSATILLNANPYAFLDGGELQERRARAVANRRTLTPDDVRDLAKLDPAAIEQVVREAQPLIRNADELHDALLSLFFLPVGSVVGRQEPTLLPFGVSAPADRFVAELVTDGRATTLALPNGQSAWVAAERLPAIRVALPKRGD